MRLGRTKHIRRALCSFARRGQRGQVLVEVLVAIAIFGVVSVAFLTALTTAYGGTVFVHNKTRAESLIRTTLEQISKAQYPVADSTTVVSPHRIEVRAQYINSSHQVVTGPTELQLITVTIKNHSTGRIIMITQNIKVKP